MESLRSSLLLGSLQVALLNAIVIVGFLLLCAKKGKKDNQKPVGKKPSAESKSSSIKSGGSKKKSKKESASAQVGIKPLPPSVQKPVDSKKIDQSKSVGGSKPVDESKPVEEGKSIGGSKQVQADETQSKGLSIVDDKQKSVSAAQSVGSVKPIQDSSYILKPDEQKNKIATAILKDMLVKPGSLLFTDNGGQGKLTLENKTGKRMAIKMKSSDNNLYRISPVFTLIDQEGNATVEVWRSSGAPKLEKLQVVYVEAPEDAKDAEIVFKAKPSGEKNASIPVVVM